MMAASARARAFAWVGVWVGAGAAVAAVGLVAAAAGEELPTLAGPAMGTTYRITLAADLPGRSRGEVHREIEAVLARIDRAASTWREDSDASRFNRAAAGDWVGVSADLAAVLELASVVHARSAGAFDVTVGPLVRLWADGEPAADAVTAALRRVGMRAIERRPATAPGGAALRKTRPGIEIDLGGIVPGHAVDCLGERLVALGSRAHLVELGGEVRAWGEAAPKRPWRVRLRDSGRGAAPEEIDLADGVALATSTCRPGRSPIDPRTGRPAGMARGGSVTVRAGRCAVADAWAVAAVVLGLEPDGDGTLTAPRLPAPSTPAAPPAATPRAP